MAITWRNQAEQRARLERERGAIVKDWGGRLPVALVYPNRYWVGMSNLGFQLLYGMLNAHPQVLCERAFHSPPSRESGAILSVESQRPLTDFHAVAFSVSYELDYYNVVDILRQSGITLLAAERGENEPLVIGGGPCLTANPEPLAPFFDAIVVGEAEPLLPELIAVLASPEDRQSQLRALAALAGVYLPAQYQPVSDERGQLLEMVVAEGAPARVRRLVQTDLSDAPGSSVVLTADTELAEMWLVEVARGCARGCRFCLAGFCYLPARERPLAQVLEMAEQGLTWTKRIGLVGAAVSDYGQFLPLLHKLRALGAEVSVSSLRVDSFTPEVATALAEGGARTATLGVEAGSQRLRDLVHKQITDEDVLNATTSAAGAGFVRVKLYYMVGLPGEEEEDVEALIRLTLEVNERLRLLRPGSQLAVTLTPFVPKAQTPYQWLSMAPADVIARRMQQINAALRPAHVAVRLESADWARVEAVLARGDRRLAMALARMGRNSLAAWNRALKAERLNEEQFSGPRAADSLLPWALIESGVSVEALRAAGGKVTAD